MLQFLWKMHLQICWVHTSEIETYVHICSWRTWWIPCPGGCRMPSGGRGTPPSTSQRSWTYLMGPFQGQNCMNKEKSKPRNRCGLILCVAHYTFMYISLFMFCTYTYTSTYKSIQWCWCWSVCVWVCVCVFIIVCYRHGGGWSRKINAWHLYTLMVYL